MDVPLDRATKTQAWYGGIARLLVALWLATASAGFAQSAPTAPGQPFSQAELDAMLAPVALYPDPLLAQILMASTYPLEVVSAARWVKANPKVTGKALEDAMHKQRWDPSVKSLAAVPNVLQMMSEKLEWTQQLGDAFLAQRVEVMTSVQALRRKAYAEGNLKSSEQQKVIVEKETIIVQPASTTVVYVPVYDPRYVYGAWWHPAYLPYYWYPPGYVVRPGVAFAAGVVVGSALWGGCNWRDHDVNINVNHYNQFNRTNVTRVNWEHDAVHRKGVAYRDPTVAQRYDRQQAANAARREVKMDRAADTAREAVDRPATRDAGAARPATRDANGAMPRGLDRVDGDADRPGPERGRPGRARD